MYPCDVDPREFSEPEDAVREDERTSLWLDSIEAGDEDEEPDEEAA